ILFLVILQRPFALADERPLAILDFGCPHLFLRRSDLRDDLRVVQAEHHRHALPGRYHLVAAGPRNFLEEIFEFAQRPAFEIGLYRGLARILPQIDAVVVTIEVEKCTGAAERLILEGLLRSVVKLQQTLIPNPNAELHAVLRKWRAWSWR